MIYFIACDQLGAVKIGFTAGDVRSRMASLQTGCPVMLRLIGAVYGTQDEERLLHRRYASRRMKGEWFRFTNGGRSSLERLLKELDADVIEENGLLYGLGLLEPRRLKMAA